MWLYIVIVLFFRERYRDLIEAADTITEMKNSAQNVRFSINFNILHLCITLPENTDYLILMRRDLSVYLPM